MIDFVFSDGEDADGTPVNPDGEDADGTPENPDGEDADGTPPTARTPTAHQ